MSDVTALEQQGTELATVVMELRVTDAPTFARAGEYVKAIAIYMKRVGEVMNPIVEAAHHSHKVAVAQRDGLLKPAEGAKRILGERMAAWEEAERRRAREAEEAARRERERLEAEARAAAEAEQRRLQAEAETRRLEAAVALEAKGDALGAARLIEEPVAVPVVAPAAIFLPQPPVAAPPRVDGVSFSDVWDFEVTNAEEIPRAYLMPDEKKIRGVVKAMKAATRIPGVRAFPRRTSTVRTA